MESEAKPDAGAAAEKPTSLVALVIGWTLTCGPLAWGVYMTLLGAMQLFQS